MYNYVQYLPSVVHSTLYAARAGEILNYYCNTPPLEYSVSVFVLFDLYDIFMRQYKVFLKGWIIKSNRWIWKSLQTIIFYATSGKLLKPSKL